MPGKKNARISYDRLQKELRENPNKAQKYFIVVQGEKPFEVYYIPDPEKVELPDGLDSADDITTRGGFVISLGNYWGTVKRRRKYRKLIDNDLDGYLSEESNFTLVAEGDSWFHYPVVEPDDPIEILLGRKMPIWTIAGAAAELRPMVTNPTYYNNLLQQRASVLLMSGGGNDMLGNNDLAERLNRYDPNKEPAAMLNKKFDDGITEAINLYRQLFEDMKTRCPTVWTVVHGYDYAVPMRNKSKGKWLYPDLSAKGCPEGQKMWEVVKEMVNRFNTRLQALAKDYERVKYIDLRNTIAPKSATYQEALPLWHDEIHAKSAGYRKVATILKREINRLADKTPIS